MNKPMKIKDIRKGIHTGFNEDNDEITCYRDYVEGQETYGYNHTTRSFCFNGDEMIVAGPALGDFK